MIDGTKSDCVYFRNGQLSRLNELNIYETSWSHFNRSNTKLPRD